MEVFFDIRMLSLLGLGFLLGMKHALDIDHIAAVSTIVSERKDLFHSMLVGILWGSGHTASLLTVGILVLLFNIQIPEALVPWMELAVAIVLIGLGLRLLWKIHRGAVLHIHVHQHHQRLHIHPHIHELADNENPAHFDHHNVTISKKPILIGVVHGFAGSAALMLIILASIPSRLVGFLYIAMFGMGSIVGMALISMVISIPFSLVSKHSTLFKGIQVGAAVVSILIGAILTSQIAYSFITTQ